MLAARFVEATAVKQAIPPEQLTLHADRGSSMTSKAVAFLVVDLRITKSHSRPYVSNDNPYSESHFKTLKYRPDFPERFGSLEAARAFCGPFFRWYNEAHHHSGIGLLTPAQLHSGQGEAVHQARQTTLAAAYAAHPERFVRRPPRPPALPEAAWIKRPKAPTTTEEVRHQLPPNRVSKPLSGSGGTEELLHCSHAPLQNRVRSCAARTSSRRRAGEHGRPAAPPPGLRPSP